MPETPVLDPDPAQDVADGSTRVVPSPWPELTPVLVVVALVEARGVELELAVPGDKELRDTLAAEALPTLVALLQALVLEATVRVVLRLGPGGTERLAGADGTNLEVVVVVKLKLRVPLDLDLEVEVVKLFDLELADTDVDADAEVEVDAAVEDREVETDERDLGPPRQRVTRVAKRGVATKTQESKEKKRIRAVRPANARQHHTHLVVLLDRLELPPELLDILTLLLPEPDASFERDVDAPTEVEPDPEPEKLNDSESHSDVDVPPALPVPALRENGPDTESENDGGKPVLTLVGTDVLGLLVRVFALRDAELALDPWDVDGCAWGSEDGAEVCRGCDSEGAVTLGGSDVVLGGSVVLTCVWDAVVVALVLARVGSADADAEVLGGLELATSDVDPGALVVVPAGLDDTG